MLACETPPSPISSQPTSVYTSHLENLMQKHLRHLQKIIMACVCSQSGSVIFNISSRVQPTWRKFMWWSPLVWKQLLPQRGLEYSAAHCNVLPRIHHNLKPHYKGSIKGCAKYCKSWKCTQPLYVLFFLPHSGKIYANKKRDPELSKAFLPNST